jgi:hypothetical protein
MKTIEMLNICMALPQCELLKPNEVGCQFIVDKHGNRVGHIHWQSGEVAVYMEYEYCEEVIEILERETGQRFSTVRYPDPEEECRQIAQELREDGFGETVQHMNIERDKTERDLCYG